MTEREFWQEIRRGLVTLLKAVEAKLENEKGRAGE